MKSGTCIVLGILFVLCRDAAADCVYPTDWTASGPFTDSVKGQVTFTNLTMEGYSIQLLGHDVSSWKCYLRDGPLLLSKNREPVSVNAFSFHVFICMVLDVKENFFLYKLWSEKQTNAGNERVLTTLSDTAVLCDVCNKDFIPDISEVRSMRSQGFSGSIDPSIYVTPSTTCSIIESSTTKSSDSTSSTSRLGETQTSQETIVKQDTTTNTDQSVTSDTLLTSTSTVKQATTTNTDQSVTSDTSLTPTSTVKQGTTTNTDQSVTSDTSLTPTSTVKQGTTTNIDQSATSGTSLTLTSTEKEDTTTIDVTLSDTWSTITEDTATSTLSTVKQETTTNEHHSTTAYTEQQKTSTILVTPKQPLMTEDTRSQYVITTMIERATSLTPLTNGVLAVMTKEAFITLIVSCIFILLCIFTSVIVSLMISRHPQKIRPNHQRHHRINVDMVPSQRNTRYNDFYTNGMDQLYP